LKLKNNFACDCVSFGHRQSYKCRTLEGIGENLAGKIEEIMTTRRLGVLEEIEKRMPAPQRRGVHMARPANMLCLDPRQKPCQCGGS
jgi:DNA polymerase/3'-5' exonuclease PolX